MSQDKKNNPSHLGKIDLCGVRGSERTACLLLLTSQLYSSHSLCTRPVELAFFFRARERLQLLQCNCTLANPGKKRYETLSNHFFVYILSLKTCQIKLDLFFLFFFFLFLSKGSREVFPCLTWSCLLSALAFSHSSQALTTQYLYKTTISEQHIVLDFCTVTGFCRVSVSSPQYFSFFSSS